MQQDKQYVGIDLHCCRSVVVRRSAAGETLSTTKIENSAANFLAALAAAGEEPEVVLEASYGAKVHLAHPLGNNRGHRRVKNDERDATDLVDLLRLGRLAESWVAPPPLRELRELVRYRHRLVEMRTSLESQAHSVLAKKGWQCRCRTCSGSPARNCSGPARSVRRTGPGSSRSATWSTPLTPRWASSTGRSPGG